MCAPAPRHSQTTAAAGCRCRRTLRRGIEEREDVVLIAHPRVSCSHGRSRWPDARRPALAGRWPGLTRCDVNTTKRHPKPHRILRSAALPLPASRRSKPCLKPTTASCAAARGRSWFGTLAAVRWRRPGRRRQKRWRQQPQTLPRHVVSGEVHHQKGGEAARPRSRAA